MDRGQIIFLSVAGVVILYQVIKGWRLGVVRQIVRFAALAAAYLAAFWSSGTAALFLKPLGYPNFVLQCLGGTLVGLVVYLFLCLIGGILFKRTAHQDVGLVWFLYGITGALIGAAFGLVLMFFVADAVRLLGSIAQADTAKSEHPVNTGLIELKKSLENGVSGEVLKTLDPVPKNAYSIAEKLGRTVSDSQAVERFLNYPGATELAARSDIQALLKDPDILQDLRARHYLPLLKNEKIVRIANDPKTAALIKQFDLEKALDYAVGK